MHPINKAITKCIPCKIICSKVPYIMHAGARPHTPRNCISKAKMFEMRRILFRPYGIANRYRPCIGLKSRISTYCNKITSRRNFIMPPQKIVGRTAATIIIAKRTIVKQIKQISQDLLSELLWLTNLPAPKTYCKSHAVAFASPAINELLTLTNMVNDSE